ncbi:MAG: flagellar hook-associated protein FlgK [Alphaproteobacteria bacterium]
MSLDTAMSGATSALRTVQQQISLVSNNINNATTPGYTRKGVNLSPMGDGVELVGVKISDYTRATDSNVLKQLAAALATDGMKSAQQEYLSQVQDILGSSSDNVRLTAAVQAFGDSWTQLQAEPESVALQNEVIRNGTSLAAEIRRISSQVEQLDRSIQSDISSSVTELNQALRDVESANSQIATAHAAAQPTGNYEDQRDVALQKIAQFVDIRVMDRSNGQIAVYTPKGYALLDGQPQQFAFDGTNVTVAGSATVVNANLAGGKFEGLLGLRANSSPAAADPSPTQEVIRKLRAQLDQIANGFLADTTGPDSFAHVYNGATAATGELATGFFTGTNRTDFNVNVSLLNGSATVKRLAATPVATAMADATRSFAAAGQTTANVTYGGYAQDMISTWQTGAKRAKDEAATAASQKDYFTKLNTDQTAVSVDSEMVKLQQLQISYQAAARLIGVIQQMNQVIINMVS